MLFPILLLCWNLVLGSQTIVLSLKGIMLDVLTVTSMSWKYSNTNESKSIFGIPYEMHSSPHSIHGRAGIHWMRHKKSEKWVFGKKCSRARFGMKAADEQPLNIETLFVSKPHSACTAHQFAKNTYPVGFLCFCIFVSVFVFLCQSSSLICKEYTLWLISSFSHISLLCAGYFMKKINQ